MKIEYKIKQYRLENDTSDRISMVLPNEFLIAQYFINGIYDKEIGEWVLEGINSVLSGKSEYEERDGEDFGIKIKKDITVAYDQHAEDKGETRESTIDTQDLKELVEVWTKAIDEFHKSKNQAA